jgi:hypothetical protein
MYLRCIGSDVMEEDLTGERVESIDELSEGDTVYVSESGHNIAADVWNVRVSSYGPGDDRKYVDLHMVDGYRVMLHDSEDGPLTTHPFDGISSRKGPVIVERADNE